MLLCNFRIHLKLKVIIIKTCSNVLRSFEINIFSTEAKCVWHRKSFIKHDK